MTRAISEWPALSSCSAHLSLRQMVIVAGFAVVGVALRFGAFLYATGETGFDTYLERLCIWSCEWYRSIASNGYDDAVGIYGHPDRANWAYFPLYPISLWLFASATGLPLLLSGFILSNTFVTAAAIVSRPLFGDNARAYWFFAFTLLAGPFAFLFSTLYSESLFILLTVLALVALQRSSYLSAAGAGMLLSATRPTGVLIVFAILAQMLLDHRRGGGAWVSFPRRLLGDVNLLLPLFLAPLGLFVHMAYLHLHTGDALAFAHIQRGWGRSLDNPIETLLAALGNGLTVEYHAMVRHSWAWAAVIGSVLSVALALRGRLAASSFCLLCILVSLTSGIGSMVRFVAGLAPLGMVVAELLSRSRLLAYLAAVGAALLGVVLTVGRLNQSTFVM